MHVYLQLRFKNHLENERYKWKMGSSVYALIYLFVYYYMCVHDMRAQVDCHSECVENRGPLAVSVVSSHVSVGSGDRAQATNLTILPAESP